MKHIQRNDALSFLIKRMFVDCVVIANDDERKLWPPIPNRSKRQTASLQHKLRPEVAGMDPNGCCKRIKGKIALIIRYIIDIHKVMDEIFIRSKDSHAEDETFGKF